MAGASLLTLLDDIATLLDDVSVMSKLAVKKSAGVLGDDLALNAQQVSGVTPDRELPVVWAVAKGSLINKAILVPAALAISAFVPWALTPLLMIGGVYLCYEGVEKIAHKFLHDPEDELRHRAAHAQALVDPTIDLVALERDKIRGAIRTDFILSAEIIVIALATMTEATLAMQTVVLAAVALAITIGVYGVVAGIVKLDDLGLYLIGSGEDKSPTIRQIVGQGILKVAPLLMRTLSLAGTVAMFLVGGGILTHGIAPLHHAIEHGLNATETHGGLGAAIAWTAPKAIDLVVGLIAGGIALAVVLLVKRLIGKDAGGAHAH